MIIQDVAVLASSLFKLGVYSAHLQEAGTKESHDFYQFLMTEPEPSSGQNPQINSMTAGFVLPFQHVVVLHLRICWRMFEIYPPGNQRIHTYPLPVGSFESMMLVSGSAFFL